VPNNFRYRFSWAPRGVLTALLTPARFVDGAVQSVAERPWEAVERLTVNGEAFEVYPNRDSVPYLETYRFPRSWTVEKFVRGTLRLSGWSDAWAPVFTELPNAAAERITTLANELADRYPTTPADRDRVVMSVALDLRTDSGRGWRGEHTLDVVGDETESATPRLVSTTLARGILDITGRWTAPGLHVATNDPESSRRWLAFLRAHGIETRFRVPTDGSPAGAALFGDRDST
jgi:hypothetical protein